MEPEVQGPSLPDQNPLVADAPPAVEDLVALDEQASAGENFRRSRLEDPSQALLPVYARTTRRRTTPVSSSWRTPHETTHEGYGMRSRACILSVALPTSAVVVLVLPVLDPLDGETFEKNLLQDPIVLDQGDQRWRDSAIRRISHRFISPGPAGASRTGRAGSGRGSSHTPAARGQEPSNASPPRRRRSFS